MFSDLKFVQYTCFGLLWFASLALDNAEFIVLLYLNRVKVAILCLRWFNAQRSLLPSHGDEMLSQSCQQLLSKSQNPQQVPNEDRL